MEKFDANTLSVFKEGMNKIAVNLKQNFENDSWSKRNAKPSYIVLKNPGLPRRRMLS